LGCCHRISINESGHQADITTYLRGKPETFILFAFWCYVFSIIKEPYTDTSVKIFLGLPCEIQLRSRFHTGALLFFDFTVGEIDFLADFLFYVLAFGSFAKISVSRRARVFANVLNQDWTKNVTKKLYVGGYR
jgi:hypothetical protein